MGQPRRHPPGFAARFIVERRINVLRFSAGEDLLDSGATIVDETGRTRLSGMPLLLAVQLTRATHAFEALIETCRIGRGVPAAGIARTLLEDALDAHWVAANPDLAPTLADRHERLVQLAERNMERSFGRPAERLDEAEQADLESLAAEYRNFRLSWTKASERDRIQLVKERWGEEATLHIDYIYDVVHRRNNVLVHGSPAAYRLAFSHSASRGRQINRMGPDRWWIESLRHGGLGYYFTCRVVADELGIEKGPAANAFQVFSGVTRDLAAEDIADVPQDAPCPCGSGRPLGGCHAS